MYLEFMTRGVFDTLIIAVILIGGALAFIRLYRDFTRPLPPENGAAHANGSQNQPQWSKEDTQPINTQDINTDTKPHEE